MSTLRNALDALLNLQKIDSDRDRLARSLKNLGTSATVLAEAQAAQDAAAGARAELARVLADQKDSELELSGLEKKLKMHEDRVRSGVITNSKELMNVQKEIGQLIRLRAALDDKILEFMDKVEALQIAKNTAEANATEQEQRKSAYLENLIADRSRIEGSLADLNSQRKEAVSLIDNDELLKQYEAIRARSTSGGIAIGRTQGSTCGGCHMQISSIDATRARAGEQVVICDNCGRIMA